MTQAARAVALLEWLATQPNGACKTEIPDDQFSDASTVLRRFCERGQVGFVLEPGMKAGNPRRRYFVRDQCPEGATLAPLKIPRRAQLAADPNHKPVPRHVAKPLTVKQPPPRSPTSPEFARAEPIITGQTVVTIWTPPKDPRAVGKPEPFFAAGKRLEPRPWAAAVAGGAR